ncbi:PKD domain-containing protein [Crenothrix polyspora]|uniref:Putative Cytochrome c5530 family protein n=1 Tax=Crenothrix polyspora TaxID=360316 RepID=A0A1R4HK36_9GAMM|nr:PKD domain-containing protein [Crenothrix polyspora]SJM96598.1 putative Cytochrome c5530 family protein [Crenothrix polyspora]
MISFRGSPSQLIKLAWGLLLFFIWGLSTVLAAPVISRLVFNATTRTLLVEGTATAGPVGLYDAIANQQLSAQALKNGKFAFNIKNLPTVPCRVRIMAGNEMVVKTLSQEQQCKTGDLPPVCTITNPTAHQHIKFGQSLHFAGKATDPEHTTLHYEWDFGGGAAVRPQSANAGAVKFDLADNTTYNVHFIATDLKGRRCADVVQVTVGTPPNTPAMVAEAKITTDGKHVVIPFTPMGMEFHDQTYKTVSQQYPINSINALVIKKGGVGLNRPQVLTNKDKIQLQYSAASNPFDPVGAGSINSTSQNYPKGARFESALIKKTDYYDPCVYTGKNDIGGKPTKKGQVVKITGAKHTPSKAACIFGAFWDYDAKKKNSWGTVDILPDEGQKAYNAKVWSEDPKKPGVRGYVTPTGVAMPGINNPYKANDPQAFNGFDATKKLFKANGLAQFPTDDKGRHNAYPLMRVQAKAGGKVLATSDAVTAVSTEFHCAECHTYGKIGADQSVYDQLKKEIEKSPEGSAWANYKKHLYQIPQFVKPASNSRADIEQAALVNILETHDFTYGFAQINRSPNKPWPGDNFKLLDAPKGMPQSCGAWCHRSQHKVDESWGPMLPKGVSAGGSCPEFPNALHNTHGRMLGTMRPDFTGEVERDPVTKGFKMVDLSKPIDPLHPLLLKTVDGGKPDGSCFFCHQGKQDKYQRDVMTTAGVNCIDCHGDMPVQAGASAMVSRGTGGGVNPPDNNIGKEFKTLPRHAYLDGLPSCGSCHTGHGDEPVLRRAYDMTTGNFKKLAAKRERFAENFAPRIEAVEDKAHGSAYKPIVAAKGKGKSCPPGTFKEDLKAGSNVCERGLFKESLDKHANIPCSSCHGAAHSIWPNPNPYANDNVTATQIQGHPGTIVECKACHTADAFKGGKVNSVSGLSFPKNMLAGPHNMHPVDDAFWWKSSDGKAKDYGAHAAWAKKPGVAGEPDQCSSCHGKDHKGSRLSKTPVDRSFTFTTSLGATVTTKVKAGTPVSCGTCHSVEKSFKKSPLGKP